MGNLFLHKVQGRFIVGSCSKVDNLIRHRSKRHTSHGKTARDQSSNCDSVGWRDTQTQTQTLGWAPGSGVCHPQVSHQRNHVPLACTCVEWKKEQQWIHAQKLVYLIGGWEQIGNLHDLLCNSLGLNIFKSGSVQPNEIYVTDLTHSSLLGYRQTFSNPRGKKWVFFLHKKKYGAWVVYMQSFEILSKLLVFRQKKKTC